MGGLRPRLVNFFGRRDVWNDEAESPPHLGRSSNSASVFHRRRLAQAFRRGKGDLLAGDVRVCVQAWWPGVIKPGQVVGEIVYQNDLCITFARLGGAKQYVPTDRVIGGIDQSSLLLSLVTVTRRFETDSL